MQKCDDSLLGFTNAPIVCGAPPFWQSLGIAYPQGGSGLPNLGLCGVFSVLEMTCLVIHFEPRKIATKENGAGFGTRVVTINLSRIHKKTTGEQMSYDPGPNWWLDKTADNWLRERNRNRNKNRRKKRQQAKRKQVEPPRAWSSYKEYLETDWWKEKRYQKLRSVKFQCERCSRRKYLQIHHKHYKSLGKEKITDLEALCKECHKREHERAIAAKQHLDSIQRQA